MRKILKNNRKSKRFNGFSKGKVGIKYNIDSYGKFIVIPMDNGARMELEMII